MTDTTLGPVTTRSTGYACFLAAAMAANVFVIVTVNYWIYYARIAFIATHPVYVAEQPPTISRAISDPLIGEPFAFWVGISAVALSFGVLGITLVYLRIAQSHLFDDRGGRGILICAAVAVAVFQAASAVGMYMLSAYRFPDHNAVHMVGSILFFVAQTLVIVVGVVVCTTLLARPETTDALQRAGQMRRSWVLFRKWLGLATVGLAVIYMALFLGKNADFGAANEMLYATYVTVEPIVITLFLAFLGTFQTDLWAVMRGRTLD